uniref:Arginine/serine-rich protein PNISR-like n=1 Tax=Globodera pallida TaxID=36090 RepID=A0A183BK24_GLOPA
MNYQQQQSHLFSSYNNPTEGSEDINWAQLAQRWIQTQHSHQQPYPAQTQPPPPPPSRLPYQHGVPPAALFHGMPPPPPPSRPPSGFFPTPLSQVTVGPPQHNWRLPQNWAHQPPTPNIGYQALGMASVASYPYVPRSQGPTGRQDEEEYQAHYDPSLEQEESNDQRPPELYTQMRKKLPAWILEGLEKAEREKQKNMEKEEVVKKRKEKEEERRKQREARGIGKFEVDSDDDVDDKDEDAGTSNSTEKETFPIRKFREFVEEDNGQHVDEDEDERTEEQRMEEAVMVVRRLMTTVLLETTNGEFERIADDVLTKWKAKAQPKILAQSTALAALTSLAGNDEDLSSSEDEEESKQPKKSEDLMENKRNVESKEKEEEAKHGKINAETNGGSEPVVFKVPLAPPQVKRKEERGQQTMVDKDTNRRKEEEGDEKKRKGVVMKPEVGRNHAKDDRGVESSSLKHNEKETSERSGHGGTVEHRHPRERDGDRERRREQERRDEREGRGKSDRRRDKDLPAQYRLDDRERHEREGDRKRRRSRSRSPTSRRYRKEVSPRR